MILPDVHYAKVWHVVKNAACLFTAEKFAVGAAVRTPGAILGKAAMTKSAMRPEMPMRPQNRRVAAEVLFPCHKISTFPLAWKSPAHGRDI